MGKPILGPRTKLEDDAEQEAHRLASAGDGCVEGAPGIPRQVAHQRQHRIGEPDIVLRGPHVVEEGAVRPADDVDRPRVEADARSWNPVLAAEAMKPAAARGQQVFAHPLFADRGGQHMDLAHVRPRPALDQEAIERLRDDLGR